MKKTEFMVQHIPVYHYTGNVPARYALLLLPGIGGYGGYYDSYCEVQVEHGAEIWGMDPPAHGRSELRRGNWTIAAYLADIVTLAAHIKGKTGLPVITLGSSLGSGAAFYAMELSDDIAGGIGMGVCIGAAGWMRRVRELFNSPDVTALMEIFGPAFEMNNFRTIRLEDNYGSKEMVERILIDPLISERQDLASYKSFVCYDPPTPPSQNRKPYLMAVGGADPLLSRKQVDRVFGNLGGPTVLNIVEGAPHQLMLHNPERFSAMVEEWIGQHVLVPTP